jgi:hypothetical protein
MGDGDGAWTGAGLSCGPCGTELPPDSRFCNKCGAPVKPAATPAEYKQVTVLFADVVHSMDIAAAVVFARTGTTVVISAIPHWPIALHKQPRRALARHGIRCSRRRWVPANCSAMAAAIS